MCVHVLCKGTVKYLCENTQMQFISTSLLLRSAVFIRQVYLQAIQVYMYECITYIQHINGGGEGEGLYTFYFIQKTDQVGSCLFIYGYVLGLGCVMYGRTIMGQRCNISLYIAIL